MENNERKVNLAGIFLILAIVIIMVMGCYIVTLLNTQKEQEKQVAELTTQLSQTQAENTKYTNTAMFTNVCDNTMLCIVQYHWNNCLLHTYLQTYVFMVLCNTM